MAKNSSLIFPKDDDDFMFESTDGKGHKADIRVTVPPAMWEIMQEIRENGHFPYRTMADLCRDALYHRIKFLSTKKDGRYDQGAKQLRSMSIAIQIERSASDHDEWLNDLTTVLNKIPEQEEQSRFVNNQYQEAMKMPEGYWKNRFVATLQTRFGHLIKPFDMGKRAEE